MILSFASSIIISTLVWCGFYLMFYSCYLSRLVTQTWWATAPCFIMTLTLGHPHDLDWERLPSHSSAFVAVRCFRGNAAQRLRFLLVSQFMDPLEGQVIQSRTQNILEWLPSLRKDFFLPRAKAEMNFSMEPVWTDLLTSLIGVPPSGGIRVMKGPTPNPSLTRADTSLRPQKGC